MVHFPRLPARVVALGLALLLVAPHAFALQSTSFDPARDLERFSEVNTAEFKEFYALDEFHALFAREMTAGELDGVRARWKAAVQAGDAMVKELESDPPRRFRYTLGRRLASNAYFSQVKFNEDRAAGPWRILVEKVFQSRYDPTDDVVALYGPWLEKLAQVFDAAVVKKLGLARRKDYGGLALLVLDGRQAFAQYLRGSDLLSIQASEHAVYDPRLRAVVTYADPSEKDAEPKALAFAAMRMGLEALLHAHFNGSGQLVPQEWIALGLGDYFCWTPGNTPASLDRRTTPDWVYELLPKLIADPEQRETVLYSLADMADVRDEQDVVRFARQRAQRGNEMEALAKAYFAFHAEAVAWTQFLHEGEGGKHLEAYGRYLRRALAGDGGAAAMRECFQGANLEEVEVEFWKWTFERCRKLDPKLNLDPSLLGELTKRSKKVRAEAAAAGFQPRVLALESADAEALRGWALAEARRGDVDGALARLAKAKPADAQASEAVKHDVARFKALSALRSAFVERLVASEQRISIEIGGTKYVNVKAAKAEGGTITFAPNKQGLERVAVAEIPWAELVRLTDKKEWQGAAPSWARAYALLLAGDAGWAKKLGRDESTEAAQLRGETVERLDALVRQGAIAEHVDALAKLELPLAPAAAKAALPRLEALAKAFEAPLVAARRAHLAALARIVLRSMAEEAAPAQLLHGQVTALDGDRLRVVYEFDAEAERRDFAQVEGYEDLPAESAPLAFAKQPSLTVQGGALRLSGSAFWRHGLPFDAPLRMEYAFRIAGDEQSLAQRRVVLLNAHVCDDLRGSSIVVSKNGALAIRDSSGQFRNFGPARQDTRLNTDYAVEIVHEGGSVKTYVGKEGVDGSPVGQRRSGAVGFFVHSDYSIEIQRLVIEGAVPKDAWKGLRETWVEGQVESLGF